MCRWIHQGDIYTNDLHRRPRLIHISGMIAYRPNIHCSHVGYVVPSCLIRILTAKLAPREVGCASSVMCVRLHRSLSSAKLTPPANSMSTKQPNSCSQSRSCHRGSVEHLALSLDDSGNFPLQFLANPSMKHGSSRVIKRCPLTRIRYRFLHIFRVEGLLGKSPT